MTLRFTILRALSVRYAIINKLNAVKKIPVLDIKTHPIGMNISQHSIWFGAN